MVVFSNDVDIARYEPALFGDLHLRGQVLASGTGGTVSGTTFAAVGADFVGALVAAGNVIYLRSGDGAVEGVFEVCSVDSATELTVSAVRADGEEDVIAPPACSDVTYRISTYRPQASEAGLQLTRYFGLRPGKPESDYDAEDILDEGVLRFASVFAVIAGAYVTLASGADEEGLWKKHIHYRKLFERERERCRLGLDVSGDGIADIVKAGSVRRLRRD
jgi:hypothetical protein